MPEDWPASIEYVEDRRGSPLRETTEMVFEATLRPHQSLGSRGILILTCALSVLSVGVALRFVLLGAWPVLVFAVLEVGVVDGMLALSRRRARAREIIRLDSAQITVVQSDPDGRRRSFSLPSAWLQVRLEEAIHGQSSRIVLRTHGQRREVGAFLHEPDKRSLFEALQAALCSLRQPRFDNAAVLQC
jgi:uncharacterized membrane protein